MSIRILEKISNLELSILQQKTKMNAEDARKFYDTLDSYYEEYVMDECNILKNTDSRLLPVELKELLLWIDDLGECIQKKTTRLRNILKMFLLPTGFTSPNESKVNYQNIANDLATTAVNLKTLLRKQKFYVQMIDSLAPKCELSPEEAELRYEHISQFYEKFISNQNEIVAFVEDDAFEDQVNISKEVQHKVLVLQGSLKKIFASNKAATLPKSEINEHCNPTDHPNVIKDSLDSLYKKRKSIMSQIELFESEDFDTVLIAETFYDHISQLHESFVETQTKIETYVTDAALEKELEISEEELQKVTSLQIKLKEILSIAVPSSDESKSVGELNSLLEQQKSQFNDMKAFEKFFLIVKKIDVDPNLSNHYESLLQSSLKIFLEFKKLCISNQNKIEKLVPVTGDDLYRQMKVSEKIQKKLTEIQSSYNHYLSLMRVVKHLGEKIRIN